MKHCKYDKGKEHIKSFSSTIDFTFFIFIANQASQNGITLFLSTFIVWLFLIFCILRLLVLIVKEGKKLYSEFKPAP